VLCLLIILIATVLPQHNQLVQQRRRSGRQQETVMMSHRMIVVASLVSLLRSLWSWSCVEAAIKKDQITELPSWSPKALPSKQYSGYLNVNKTSFLHYWFVESENNPATDPVVLWLNGGPGCSSLDGFFYELGPFEPTLDGGLSLRPYRWNRFANMLFIEAPVGVGFSYSSTLNYNNTDDTTAIQNMWAVEKFFEGFPEYKSNSFYITGESYAGIYIPTLAEAILQAVDAGTYSGATLKGIAVGNGCTGYEVGVCGWYFGGVCEGLYYSTQFLLELPFIKQTLKDSIAVACNWTTCKNNQTLGSDVHALSTDCLKLLDRASVDLGAINIYNVYGTCTFDSCDGPEENADSRIGRVANLHVHVDRFNSMVSQMKEMSASTTSMHATDLNGYVTSARAAMKSRITIPSTAAAQTSSVSPLQTVVDDNAYSEDAVRGPVGCIDSALATAYVTRPEVMKAIHVIDPQYCWAVCNQAKGWSYEATRPNLPRDTYPYLISRLHVLVYNGDWDACVPYTDNAAWTENMGLEPTSAWKTWYYQDSYNSTQIGGYSVTYDTSSVPGYGGSDVSSFEFRTVRGAGHMVPTDTPDKGLAVLAHLLGQPASMYYYPSNEVVTDDTMSCPKSDGRPLAQLIVFIFLFLVSGIICLYLYREVKRLKVALATSTRDIENFSSGHGSPVKSGASTNPMYIGVSSNEG
jgi:serine carboxypeptidase-like clade 1